MSACATIAGLALHEAGFHLLAIRLAYSFTTIRQAGAFKLPLRFTQRMRFHIAMKNLMRYALLFTAFFTAGVWLVDARGATRTRTTTDYFVYVGTYTRAKSQGIYVYKLAAATGKLTPLGLAAESKSPSFLALDPTHRYLYAVNEIGDYEGQKSGSVSAFSIDRRAGKLTALNVVASGDAGAVHLMVDHTGKYVLVANYGVGSVAVFPILADGSLGKATAHLPHSGHSIKPRRQLGPHAHSIYVSPDNRFAVSPDLGTDQVYVYRFDATQGTLEPNDPPFVTVAPGTGPRHLAFDPRGRFAYLVQEFGGIVTVFSYDAARGMLHQLETFPAAPSDFQGPNNCAEVFVHPNGKFLYVSNRGHDSIGVYAIDPAKGTLTLIEHVPTQGKTPRGFGIDPTGSYLIAANQESNTVVAFRINVKTGRLTPTGQKLDIPEPACVVFEPAE
jgi:6-phosphogluconolactonase